MTHQNRKFYMTLISMALVLFGLVVVAWAPAVLGGAFTTFCATVVSLCGLYGGVNVASKWVTKKELGAESNE